ncbi:YgaP-like transmembrane domain [Salinilacihabitans rarus]|uniref:YgaP-like transmembrane domain n=1 Tax=Salinilacihabitans rarus TaxID=2961596 RepID=UPI0020C8F323|nr:YgaP-like transmembrane domain [Salinilacihabitans rarus]
METNVGEFDRLARFAIGTLLLLVGVAALADALAVGTAVGAVALVVGVVLVATGATRSCLLYQIVGVDTCSR